MSNQYIMGWKNISPSQREKQNSTEKTRIFHNFNCTSFSKCVFF